MPSPRKSTASEPVRILCVPEGRIAKARLDKRHAAWAAANGFSGEAGALLALPGPDGGIDGFVFGLGAPDPASPLVTGLASAALKPGAYALEGPFADPTVAALGFLLGAYRYTRYKKPADPVTLAHLDGADTGLAKRLADAAFIARDLVNTPPNDLGPDAFEAEIRAFAKARKMTATAIVGDDLIKQNLPMIHAVGRASAEAPRLLDLSWGSESHPKVTLVGKGVTFDTGGLDIKTPSGMALMKKDMGGAANVLGLAHAIVDAGLKLRLRVLIPIVENAISGRAFRPGDVLPSRAGLSVEIGNTDAEGRLILADALALADEESPDLVIDMATLTGAARAALGPDLPPLYTENDELARDFVAAGQRWGDAVWRMPLWPPYDKWLSSSIADVSHISSQPFAGSLTAALFLKRFVKKAHAWAHFDIYAWAPQPRPGRPAGGTDQAIRACYDLLARQYS